MSKLCTKLGALSQPSVAPASAIQASTIAAGLLVLLIDVQSIANGADGTVNVGAVTSGSIIKLDVAVAVLPQASIAVHVTTVVLAVHRSRVIAV